MVSSFNVRNFGQRSRSIQDILHIVDLVNESDVIAFQEVGLGLFSSAEVTRAQRQRLDALVAVLKSGLGASWDVALAKEPTGVGAGRETSILAYRKSIHGLTANASSLPPVVLGHSRGLFVWSLTLDEREITIGSVHLTPEDPDRGDEMLMLVQWMQQHADGDTIVLGDMNWGYKKTSGVENYRGERTLETLHDDDIYTQVFHEISYLGKGNQDDFRTNLGFRSTGQFYDQIFLSKSLPMASDGKLGEDCGILIIAHAGSYFQKQTLRFQQRRQFGLTKLKSNFSVDYSEPGVRRTVEQAKDATKRSSLDEATWSVSDHRPIWVKLSLE